MTSSNNRQGLWFAVSLMASLYLIHHKIPQDLSQKININLPEIPSVDASVQPSPSLPLPLASQAIRFKASGEDPFAEDGGFEAYQQARQQFERRLGYSLSESWHPYRMVRENFPVPEGIRDRVNFWIRVFGRYGKDQYIFHHRDDPGIVYSLIDLKKLGLEESEFSPQEWESLKNRILAEERFRVQNRLKILSQKIRGGDLLSPEEQKLAELFGRIDAPLLSKAADAENIRVQGGFSHRFREAIVRSGRYMNEIENIFSMKGLPVELTRLPLIESAFHVNATSPAKAVGIWQFIPETGERYVKIDSIADERFDPILATYAAAEHLEREYQLLGSWPLAINSYNTGPGRILKAKEELKTDDIAIIINKFNEPGYQFYSRNYYPEFLAALHVYENQQHYFGNIEKLPSWQYDIFIPPFTVNLGELARRIDVDPEVMKELNPALAKGVLEGITLLPPGYMVRVPNNLGRLFAVAAEEVREEEESSRWYLAMDGETLEEVATRYGIPVELFKEYSPATARQPLTAGQLIEIPSDTGVAFGEAHNDVLTQ